MRLRSARDIQIQAEGGGKATAAMTGNSSVSSTEADTSQGGRTSGGFDNYQSLGDSNLAIFVAKDAVSPFRFKAGGWELIRSSIELGLAMKARIAEKGYFMYRVNGDQTAGWNRPNPKPRLQRGNDDANFCGFVDRSVRPLFLGQ
jgi:hypothetical protein